MKTTQIVVLSIAVAGFGLTTGCGCDSIGSAPSGMSEQDAKTAIDKMSPEDKIKAIASSPMAQKDKDAKYLEIEKETGVKASDVLSGKPPVPTGAGN